MAPDLTTATFRSVSKLISSENNVVFEVRDIHQRFADLAIRKDQDSTASSEATIESPVYEFKYLSKGKRETWRANLSIALKRKDSDEDREDHLSLFISCQTKHMAELLLVLAEFEIRAEGKVQPLKYLSLRRYFSSSHCWGWCHMIAKDAIPKKFSTLIIEGKITIFSDHISNEAEPMAVHVPKATSNLSSMLAKDEIKSKYSDFTVISREEEAIPFYKCVLAARSPVFRAMMETAECKEHKFSEVAISDFGTVSLKVFLNFLLRDVIIFDCFPAEDLAKSGEDENTLVGIVRNLLLLVELVILRFLLSLFLPR